MLFRGFILSCLLVNLPCLPKLHAQWVKTSGSFGTEVFSVALNSSYQFAGTGNGVYRATLGSPSWELGNDYLLGKRINVFAIGTNKVYAGTDKGLFVSSDEGMSWQQAGLSNQIITALLIKDSLLFAGTVDGVLTSSDNGATWSQIDSGLVSKYVVTFVANSDLVFVSTHDGLYKLSDCGGNFVSTHDGLYKFSACGANWVKTNFGEYAVLAAMIFGNTLLASSWDNVVFRSTDSGETWTSSGIGKNSTMVTCFTTNGQNVYAAANDSIYLSVDSGKTWVSTSAESSYFHEVIAEDSYVIAGSKEGIYASTDAGVTWDQINNGLVSSDVTSLAASDSKLFAGTFGSGVYLSTNNGTTWSSYSTGISSPNITGLGMNSDILFAGAFSGIYRTEIAASSWNRVSSDNNQLESHSFYFDDNIILAGSIDGVLRSTDNGDTWKRIDSIHTSNSYYQAWTVLSVGSTIIAGYNQRGIRISTNSGLTWEYSNSGLSSLSTVNALVHADSRILAGAGGIGVVLSSDSGASWTPSSLDTTSVLSFLRYRHTIFAAAYTGVYKSIDNGITWTRISEGLDDYGMTSLAATDEYLFAGASGGSVWRRPLSEVTSVSIDRLAKIPDGFDLSPNYPNPFNPMTTIQFSVTKESHVTLAIFNTLGATVEVLADRTFAPGNYQVQWTPQNLASGVYFYRLQTADFTHTRKLLLLR